MQEVPKNRKTTKIIDKLKISSCLLFPLLTPMQTGNQRLCVDKKVLKYLEQSDSADRT